MIEFKDTEKLKGLCESLKVLGYDVWQTHCSSLLICERYSKDIFLREIESHIPEGFCISPRYIGGGGLFADVYFGKQEPLKRNENGCIIASIG
jgi:hypothetical protein